MMSRSGSEHARVAQNLAGERRHASLLIFKPLTWKRHLEIRPLHNSYHSKSALRQTRWFWSLWIFCEARLTHEPAAHRRRQIFLWR